MRKLFAAAGLIALGVTGALADAQRGGGPLPAGWQMRPDSGDTSGVRFSTMGTGFHVMTGPAAIFYRPDMKKSGRYQVQATFMQMEPAAQPEAYGLVVGGVDLAGPKQKYTYFLIRQDGQFLVKKRAGRDTPTLKDWTPHAAIQKTEGSTKGTNALAVAVGADKVRFLVNGTEVASLPASQIDTNGIVGLRINHNLNVHIEGFEAK